MKLLIACLATETNTFSLMPTGRLAFEAAKVRIEPNLNAAVARPNVR